MRSTRKKKRTEKQPLRTHSRSNLLSACPKTEIPPGNPKANNGPDKQKFKTTADYKKIEEQYDTAEADFVRDFTKIHTELSEEVIKQVNSKKIIPNKDLKALKTLRVSKTELKRLMSLYYAKLYLEGKGSAIEEVKGRIPKKMAVRTYLDGEAWLDRTWVNQYLDKYGDLGTLNAADKLYLTQLRDRAFYITGDIEERILREVRTIITSGLDSGTTASTMISQISSKLSADRRKYAITIARTNASDAFNSGRMNFFQSDDIRPLIEAYQYSAIIDNVTTEYCESHDGQIIYPNDPAFGTMNPPNHFNCRSLLIPIMVAEGSDPNSPYYNYKTDEETWGTGVSHNYRLPAEGFGGIARASGGWG